MLLNVNADGSQELHPMDTGLCAAEIEYALWDYEATHIPQSLFMPARKLGWISLADVYHYQATLGVRSWKVPVVPLWRERHPWSAWRTEG